MIFQSKQKYCLNFPFIIFLKFQKSNFIHIGKCNLFFQVYSDRMSNVESTQTNLLEDIKKESIKFGDDVKYLAEFTSGMKKFDPWITKAEAKKGQGMLKPGNLEEALEALEDSKVSIFIFEFTLILFMLHFYSRTTFYNELPFLRQFLIANRRV